MTEDNDLNSLERELASMTPRDLPRSVMAELSKVIDQAEHEEKRWSWGDRLLACTMGSGMAAACVIVAMLSIQWMGNTSAPPSSASVTRSGEIRASDSLVVLARFGEEAAVDGRENVPGKPPG